MKYSIIISDTHLGAIGFKRARLQDFLADILNDNLTFFNERVISIEIEHLIILGDFFDRMMETPKGLANHFQKIYDLLKSIRERGIQVTHVLGNHEISVSGDYNTYFNERKNQFYEDLAHYLTLSNYLNRDDLCQYTLLTVNNNNFWLGKYDDINKISSNLQPGIVSFLMCHGYQFIPKHILDSESKIWDKFLKIENRIIKKLLDTLWNGVLRERGEIRVEKMISQDFLEYFIEENTELRTVEKLPLSSFKYELLNSDIQRVINQSNFERLKQDISNDYNMELEYFKIFSQRGLKEQLIEEFLSANQLAVTHIIYGHTHKVEKFKTRNNLSVDNDGAWQLKRGQDPSYIIIDVQGRSECFSY